MLALVASCSGSHEPEGLAACKQGDAKACFAAAATYHVEDKDELAKAIELWHRGCELGHGASCAQLGTVAEFGMAGRADPMTARMYYAMACKRGATAECARAGVVSAEPKPKEKFPWRDALTPVCGKPHGTIGALFDGLVLGQPMPAGMAERIAAYERKFGAHVHYYAGDPTIQSAPSLEVRFDEPEGLYPILFAGWGKPDLAFGAWTNADAHVIAYLLHSDRMSGVSWTQYRSIAELIRPDDKDKLGFEPFPVVGAKLVDLQTALGSRMLRASEDSYRWSEIGSGPGFEVRVTERRGVIVKLETVNWITNASEVGDQLLAALAEKWGKPRPSGGASTWLLPGRRVIARKPATGNFEIVIDRW
jgi:hypothetical protein